MCGSLRYQLGDREVKLEAGQLLAIEAHERHQLLEASDDAAFWVIELDAPSPFARTQGTFLIQPDLAWTRSLVGILNKLWLRPALAVEESLWDELTRMLDEPALRSPATAWAPHPAILRARKICQESTERDLSVVAIARGAGISAGRLAHLFRDQIGVSPLQYRNFCRVQRFIQQFDGTKPNLMRAALRFGFGSYPQFHRAFQQVCGAPPGAHLRQLAQDAWMKPRRTLPVARRFVSSATGPEVSAYDSPAPE